MKDGRLNQCNTCSSQMTKRWRLENPARVLDGTRAWRASNPDKMKEIRRRSAARNREAERRHPEKIRARQTVTNAVHRGKLTKPDQCSRCEAQTARIDLHAHHNDYSKPLEVEWICRDCHQREHDPDGKRNLTEAVK
jgi:hypothetical protein